uniref:Uncharacterized protein n=1 Tax=Heterorhabditis bacteriophora TaxID=37862 RepID=A0A1I7WY56_HETBA
MLLQHVLQILKYNLSMTNRFNLISTFSSPLIIEQFSRGFIYHCYLYLFNYPSLR